MNYVKYYDLEQYLFRNVRMAFHRDGFLSAFDFFCIVIWKANRAKSTVAHRLMNMGRGDLNETVCALTEELYGQPTRADRLRLLWAPEEWGFRLPMASAILAVLYPSDFTIYDTRVCDSLGGRFSDLADMSRFEKLWPAYLEYMAAVEASAPTPLSLRDKDRYLWGKSFYNQLQREVKTGFAKATLTTSGTGVVTG
ncbi:MAG TPA: hypothetical protein VGM37_19045 [Armatimonadota bacterium]|jgi:hypothetical protein